MTTPKDDHCPRVVLIKYYKEQGQTNRENKQGKEKKKNPSKF